ncbi:MAG: hypothetical protein GX587_13370 [Bacteroidales bacterium]|nr:hypothetical protein [Bacteroidales bacterium]
MKTLNFVTVDVETANKEPDSICQIGFAFVENGKITKTWDRNINPLTQIFTNSRIHGITAKDVENAITFDKAINYILPYIEKLPIIHHSTNHFDKTAIISSAEKYGIKLPELNFKNSYFYFKDILSSYNISSFSLPALSDYFNIPVENQHNAKQDALLLAKILITLSNKFQILPITDWHFKNKPKPKPEAWTKVTAIPTHEGIFSNCNFVLTGKFSKSKLEIANLIAAHGGYVKSGVSKITTHLVVGSPSWAQKSEQSSKLKRAIEINKEKEIIKIISEDELMQMIKTTLHTE